MCYCLDEIHCYRLLYCIIIDASIYSCKGDRRKGSLVSFEASLSMPVLCFADDTSKTIIFFLRLSSSQQALQNSLDFHAPVTYRHSLENYFTPCVAVTFFGWLEPSPHVLRLPFGGGLQ